MCQKKVNLDLSAALKATVQRCMKVIAKIIQGKKKPFKSQYGHFIIEAKKTHILQGQGVHRVI